MTIEWEFEHNNLAVFRVSGQLKQNEFAKMQSENEGAFQRTGGVNILVILNNFLGWERSEGWGDVSFMERTDPYLNKIAIVGDAKWRDEIFAFTGKGLRPVEIEYFGSEAEARDWLNTG